MNPQPPVSSGLELTSDLLTTQGHALRALAGSLLRDPHAAEDVVQETWLTCLRQPAVLPVRMSAWLGTVTRRLALRRVRGEDRRALRERRAAAAERLEDVAQRTLEREEALRAVTQALLALEEPFKSALLLRYYEDKAPQAIADELGLPLPTVKSRLARGLEKLRARLGTEFRGDDASQKRGLLALAGLGAPQLVTVGGAAAGGATAGLVLGAKVWAAVAALVVAGGALTWWGAAAETRGEGARALLTLAQGADGSGSDIRATAEDPARSSATDGTREDRREAAPVTAVEPAGAEAFPPEASYRYRIVGRVRDEQDLPQDGACVYLAPRLFPFNRVATTDGEGRFVIEFDARRATLDATLGFAAGGLELGLREVQLVAGQELVVDVGLRSAAEVRVAEDKVVVEPGPGAPEIAYGFEEAPAPEVFEQVRFALEARLDLQPTVRSQLDCAPEWLRSSAGRGLFVDPLPMQACGRPVQVSLELRMRRWRALSEQRVLATEGMTRYIEVMTRPQPTATVRGIVRDARGDPAPNVEVGLRFPEGGRRSRVRSDASGAFVLSEVPARALELLAGGGDDGRACERVELAAGQDLTWNPVLDRGAEVTGWLVSTDSRKPLAGQRVELWSASSSFLWCDSTHTDEDGRFALPNVPSGAFELCVYLSDSASPFPVRVLGPVFPGTELGELALTADERAGRPLTLRLRTASDAPPPGVEVRVRHEATGFVALMSGPGEDGAFTLAHLPSGAYRVEAGGPSGWRDLGTVWVDPRVEGVLDLGCERFPEPGYARLEAQAGRGSLWSVHPDVFGRVEVHESDGPRTLAMRPGEYVLCAGAREARSETPFAVVAGEGVTLAPLEATTGILARPTPLARESLSAEAVRCDACHATGAEGASSVEAHGVLHEGF